MTTKSTLIRPLTDDETRHVAGGTGHSGLGYSWRGWDGFSAGDIKSFKKQEEQRKGTTKYAKGPDLWKVAKVPVVSN